MTRVEGMKEYVLTGDEVWLGEWRVWEGGDSDTPKMKERKEERESVEKHSVKLRKVN